MRKAACLLVSLLLCAGGAVWAQQGQEEAKQPFTVNVLMEGTSTMSGKALHYPKTDAPQMDAHLVAIEPGAATGWHKHPGPTWMYILEGALTVETRGGLTRVYQAGECLLEDVGVWINNKNIGRTTVKFVAVVVGERNNPSVVFEEE